MKKTLVLGASPNSERYSYRAVVSLLRNNFDVVALGIKSGNIVGVDIDIEKKQYENIHSVTMYIGAERQPEYYDYIVSLKPERVIFNPGTYNDEFTAILEKNNIEVVEKCTLVMLTFGDY
ncbi:MAG TPA: CoA-binding protein [Bacteroidales bacterium]|nr:MAG: CoA-binding protein [Bacteroidetes bacterium GWF2_33_38]OFY73315.1 MAG: CoA-binding protein [Bacteroidetes bacterium RIFOXYA12_FULL_33_9]OFY89021.1 MAG: CoA-binding protein [Bacteroidetes bacterium RIFOXYA2_FULL_33_7]HBF88462.1 CoA-binding protein [Bacteroidales bacterium]